MTKRTFDTIEPLNLKIGEMFLILMALDDMRHEAARQNCPAAVHVIEKVLKSVLTQATPLLQEANAGKNVDLTLRDGGPTADDLLRFFNLNSTTRH